MLFNPLFVQIGVNTDSIDAPKSTKLNNTSYLFSDIIRVINDNNKTSDPLLSALAAQAGNGNTGIDGKLLNDFNLNTLSSQVVENGNSNNSVNVNDLLKKLLSDIKGSNNSSLLSLENYLSKSGDKNIHLLSNENDLNAFLQNLFSSLPDLKMVVGGDKNFIVQPVSGKTDGSSQDQKKQVEDAIINLLQTNSNIILNFNLGKDQFKIEIKRLGGNSVLKTLTGPDLTAINNGKNGTAASADAAQNEKNLNIIKDAVPDNIQTEDKTATGIKTETQDPNNIIKPDQNASGQNIFTDAVKELAAGNQSAEHSGGITGNKSGLLNGTNLPGNQIQKTALNIMTAGQPESGVVKNGTVNESGKASGQPSVTKAAVGSAAAEKPLNEIINSLPAAEKKGVKPDAVKIGTEVKSPNGKIVSGSTLSVGPEEQKYILSIKVNYSQASAGKEKIINSSGASENSTGASLTPQPDKNVNIDLSSLSENKLPASGQTENTLVPDRGNELFNPPLTLKLSLKQQIKNVEGNNPDKTKGVIEKDINNGQAQKLSNDTQKLTGKSKADNSNPGNSKSVKNSDAGNNINTNSTADNISENPFIQNRTENINQTSAVLPDMPASGSGKISDTALQETAGVSDKNLNGIKNTKGNNSGTFSEELNNINSESEKPVLQPENKGSGFENKSNGDKQNSTDINTKTAQSLNDFGKFMTVKENPGQFTSPLKTVNVSDLTKEFSKIIGQKQSKSVVLQLKPDNMGKIKLSIDVNNNIVHARVEVENDQVKQMLQANLDVLKHSLNLNGLQLSAIDVSMSGGQQRSYRSYGPKRKFQYTGKDTKIKEETDTTVNRNMGYNTYEYLI